MIEQNQKRKINNYFKRTKIVARKIKQFVVTTNNCINSNNTKSVRQTTNLFGEKV